MKYTFPRSSYVPKGAVRVASKVSSAVAYLSGDPAGRCYAVGFAGRADKPELNYSFKSGARRAQYLAQWLKSVDSREASKAARMAEKKAKLAEPQKFLAVGDVLVCSWGYEQTNIDYYQVTELIGKRKVMIQEIGCESVDTLYMQGKSVPAVGAFIGKPMLKIVNEYGGVRIASYATARKLEQVKVAGVPVGYKPQNWTAYA